MSLAFPPERHSSTLSNQQSRLRTHLFSWYQAWTIGLIFGIWCGGGKFAGLGWLTGYNGNSYVTSPILTMIITVKLVNFWDVVHFKICFGLRRDSNHIVPDAPFEGLGKGMNLTGKPVSQLWSKFPPLPEIKPIVHAFLEDISLATIQHSGLWRDLGERGKHPRWRPRHTICTGYHSPSHGCHVKDPEIP